MSVISRRLAAAVVLAIGATAAVATTAQAAPQELAFTCDGTEVMVRVPTNEAPQAWNVLRIVEGGTGLLIPLVVDVKRVPFGPNPPQPISHVVKGGGNAGPQGATVTCVHVDEFTTASLVTTVTAVARP